jgi:DNA-binding CsgD family transcriptional regulator
MELVLTDADPYLARFLHYYRGWLPCSYYLHTGDMSTVICTSDFFSDRQLRNQPAFAELFAPFGTKYDMMAALTEEPDHARRICFWRNSGRDFSERDRLVLQLLRPHLYEVYFDAQRRRSGVPRLTRREQQVLRLAARGRSNADIARELFISVSTVRKHLEHVYDRTGVRTRNAAAAIMLPHLNAAEQRIAP